MERVHQTNVNSSPHTHTEWRFQLARIPNSCLRCHLASWTHPSPVTTWQKEPQNKYCKLPRSLDFFLTGKNKSSGLKRQENALKKIPSPNILFYHHSL